MAVTLAQMQQYLVASVGDTPNALLSQNAAFLWQQAAWAGALYAPLQQQVVRRSLIDLALGYYRDQIDTSLGEASLHYQQRVTSLLAMAAQTDAMVARYQRMATASRAGTAAPITQVTPELPPDLTPAQPISQYPDANSPQYQGDAYDSPLSVV
ncbi:MAG TPA: hypothetical protein VGP33_14445 [Chloroflexota bacterium]|nr:hypothetical protein [Chloroflexota bacterium]